MTHYHRLILPADANHHATLYAGSLLRLALEAGYATTYRHVGVNANLVLRRVLNLECLRPVPVGTVIEIQGAVLHRARRIWWPDWWDRRWRRAKGRGWRRCSVSPRWTTPADPTACRKGRDRRKNPTARLGNGSANGCRNCSVYVDGGAPRCSSSS